ncbi:hypothetical protein [Actinomadura hibisca]|uniref:hypothetical protein n=1 Tax=Actinomadura hibisca TaxID=68565 RepID=UPI0012FCF576|nr:hypothetical protein [Actinomadura hibisca]
MPSVGVPEAADTSSVSSAWGGCSPKASDALGPGVLDTPDVWGVGVPATLDPLDVPGVGTPDASSMSGA